MRAICLFLPLGLAACGAASEPDLVDALSAYCGQSFEGRIVSEDPQDEDWRAQTLTIHIRDCESDRVRIPLHVGENRSRTWIISRTATGLRHKHDHRHEDGHEDVLTQYGGDSSGPVAGSVDFPVDAFSKALFERENIPASIENTWTVSLDTTRFVYALNRPERHFEAVFDLTRPVPTPPPAWGYNATEAANAH